MMISEREQKLLDKANTLLKGLIFSEQGVFENGVFKKEGVSQTLVIRTRIKQTIYPHRKYYDINIERRYASLTPKHYTLYNFYVYVDNEERITELTPLLIYNRDGWHDYRETPTSDDYADIVYRLFLGEDAFNHL